MKTYEMKAQPLAKALSDAARISGRPIAASSSLVRGKTAPPLSGRYTADQAYEALLSGSGLKLVAVGSSLVVQRAEAESAAPGEPLAGDVERLAEVVVTGTRIRGAAPVGANLIALSREDIVSSGYASTQEIVQALPQNYGGGPNDVAMFASGRNGASANLAGGSSVNLRGLGAGSTLVLLDGARPAMAGRTGVFADISLVPASAIERIEVLADGASALYGSDAVAGVVNLVFRKRFDGAESSLRYGTADGDSAQLTASQLLGRTWPGGHVVAAYEYYRRDALAAADRDYATSDLRAFGGGDYRSSLSSPGTIVAGGRYFAIPSGQNGVGLSAAQLTEGLINKTDGRRNTDILPRQARQGLFVSAEQALGAAELYAQALVSDRRFEMRSPTSSQSAVTVPVGNPFYVDPIGTHQSVRVFYNFAADLGPNLNRGHVRAYNAVLGARRPIGAWSTTLQVGYGLETEATRTDNYLNTYWLNRALADTSTAAAYNVFGVAHSTSQATIDSVRGFTSNRGRYESWSGALRADGPLLDLPAGALRLAVGAEYRTDRYGIDSLTYISTATPSASTLPLPGLRKIAAAYGELLAPLANPDMDLPGLRRLDLSLAVRAERYSDFGVTTNPKLGLNWEPVAGLVLKTAYGTSFRAPSFNDLRQGVSTNLYQPVALTDPNSPTGSTIVLALIGNKPDIGPERATTWTTTLEYRPPALSDLRLSATYFKIAYRDRISSINADIYNALINRAAYSSLLTDNPSAALVASYYAAPEFSNPSNIAASSIAVIVDARVQNLARVDEDGVDFDVDYRRQAAAGDLTLGLSGSYFLHVEQTVAAGAAKTSTLGTIGAPVRLRIRGRAGWSAGPWTLAGFVNFTDGYTNQTVTPKEHVQAWTTADLSLAYQFGPQAGRLSGVRLALSATNLFDRDPPYVNLRTTSSGLGFDGDNASPVGRVTALQVTKTW